MHEDRISGSNCTHGLIEHIARPDTAQTENLTHLGLPVTGTGKRSPTRSVQMNLRNDTSAPEKRHKDGVTSAAACLMLPLAALVSLPLATWAASFCVASSSQCEGMGVAHFARCKAWSKARCSMRKLFTPVPETEGKGVHVGPR